VDQFARNGALAMLGKSPGFVAYVKKEVPHIKIKHFMLQCHALAAKTSPTKLNDTSFTTASAVNIIRGRAHLFRALCEEIDAEHIVILFYAEGGGFPVAECLLMFL
jgi:hypothetical protein